MGEDVQRRDLHQRRQAQGRPRIVGENQETGTEGAQSTQRHAVDDRCHGVLAHAKMKIAAVIAARLEVAGAVKSETRLSRRRQVGGTAH